MSLTPKTLGPPRVSGHLGEGVLLITGPPASAGLFRGVQDRLAPLRTVAADLAVGGDGGDDVLGELARQAEALGREHSCRTLFGHGAAVPVALRVAQGAFDRVVVSNGPVTRPDPVLSVLGRVPLPVLAGGLLRPILATRWLASSAGLRRTVVNPYVMDRDTVVMLSAPWLRGPDERRAMARWWAALAAIRSVPQAAGLPISAIWGDSDPLFPMSEAQAAVGAGAGGVVLRVPGGRLFHLEERPWEAAAQLTSLLAQGLSG